MICYRVLKDVLQCRIGWFTPSKYKLKNNTSIPLTVGVSHVRCDTLRQKLCALQCALLWPCLILGIHYRHISRRFESSKFLRVHDA